LAVIGAVLALVAVTGCSDDPSGQDDTPSPSATTEAPSATESPAEPSPSAAARETIAVDEVTEEQKKACLDAIVAQLRSKKGGTMPEECAVLPDEVLGVIVDEALSGG
jgi:hypothetical protein